jgi:hypothetical protein
MTSGELSRGTEEADSTLKIREPRIVAGMVGLPQHEPDAAVLKWREADFTPKGAAPEAKRPT